MGGTKNGFLECAHVNIDLSCVTRILVCLDEMRIREPVLHMCDTTLDRSGITVTLTDHPFQHDNVRFEIIRDGIFTEFDRTSRCTSLRGRVGELESLLASQMFESLDLKNTPRENVLLSLLGN